MKRSFTSLSRESNESFKGSNDVQIIKEEVINIANNTTTENQILLNHCLTLFQGMLREHKSELEQNEENEALLRKILASSVFNLIEVIIKGTSHHPIGGEITDDSSEIDEVFLKKKRFRQSNVSYDYISNEEKCYDLQGSIHPHHNPQSACIATDNMNMFTHSDYTTIHEDEWLHSIVEREFHSFCQLLKATVEPEEMQIMEEDMMLH